MTVPDESALPPEAQEQLLNALAVAAETPTGVSGFAGFNLPDLSAVLGVKDEALKLLDTALGAINTIQHFGWLFPQYTGTIQTIEDALTKVRGWLD